MSSLWARYPQDSRMLAAAGNDIAICTFDSECFDASTSLEPLKILLVDVSVKSHSGFAYMGLVPRAGRRRPGGGGGCRFAVLSPDRRTLTTVSNMDYQIVHVV